MDFSTVFLDLPFVSLSREVSTRLLPGTLRVRPTLEGCPGCLSGSPGKDSDGKTKTLHEGYDSQDSDTSRTVREERSSFRPFPSRHERVIRSVGGSLSYVL